MRWIQGRFSAAACVVLFPLILVVISCGEPLSTPEPVFLRVSGSMTMADLVSELALAFEQQSVNTSLEVVGLGTKVGLDDLRHNEADLAMASWLPAELEDNWRTVAIARDGIAIIVHPSNPLTGMGLLQLQDLFSGRAHEWQAVGGQFSQGAVEPVSREEGAGTRMAFESLVMENSVVTSMAVLVASPQSVVEYVAQHPQAIGYVSMGFLSSDVKVLSVEGEVPSPTTTSQERYPLTHELWLIVPEPADKIALDLVQFAQSPAGQQIVGQRFGRVK